jgi:type IV pilus assembly protein PilW
MRTNEKGFGLVEIMVGLAIGMLAMIVVMQVYSQNEAQKRSTTGGADATNNGAIALTMIERDARNAGWGMDITHYADCATAYTYCDGSAACGGSAGPISDFSLQSLVIKDGGTKPDSVFIRYFADPNQGSFRQPTKTKLRATMPQPSAELDVASTDGCDEGNLALMVQGDHCTLIQVTHMQGQALKVQHNPGANGSFNPSENFQKTNNWPSYTKGAALSCFPAPDKGPQFIRSYSIDADKRQLLRTDNATETAASNEVVSSEIVDLQAQYGVAPLHSQSVNQWVDATGTWAAPTADDRTRIKALRIVLVARSAQYEKPDPSGTCSATTQAMVATWPAWANFNTANFAPGWQCYRYKVFETVVPLRNVLWGRI